MNSLNSDHVETYFKSTKSYYNYPCAHRQWRHDGSCALVHGYSRSFHFVFGARQMTKENFLVDYGDLKELKNHLDSTFDHTLLLSPDDPEIPVFRELETRGACSLKILPYGPSMEGTSQYLCEWTDNYIREKSKGRAWVISVEARENDKNSTIYENPNAGFKGWI